MYKYKQVYCSSTYDGKEEEEEEERAREEGPAIAAADLGARVNECSARILVQKEQAIRGAGQAEAEREPERAERERELRGARARTAAQRGRGRAQRAAAAGRIARRDAAACAHSTAQHAHALVLH